MENAIEIVHVTKKFKETVAVNGVTVSLERGKIHGIIGRNGSGKTVLFKCICGLDVYKRQPYTSVMTVWLRRTN